MADLPIVPMERFVLPKMHSVTFQHRDLSCQILWVNLKTLRFVKSAIVLAPPNGSLQLTGFNQNFVYKFILILFCDLTLN